MKIIKYSMPFVFIILGFLTYSNVLHGPFLFDDDMYITNNYWIRDITNFLKDFSGTRYIGFLSFSINYHFGGLNTFGYHIINILIHIINTLLVYLLVQITIDRLKHMGSEYSGLFLRYLAMIVALIFLVHPIQTQSVSYITQRVTSLATLFYLLALVLYVTARTKEHGARDMGQQEKRTNIDIPLYILSILSAILAMKTKEISFTLPFVILLYEWTFPLNKGGHGVVSHLLRVNNNPLNPPLLRGNSTKRFFYLLPFFLTLCIIPLNFLLTQDTGDISSTQNIIGEKIRKLQLGDIENISHYSYLMTQFRVIITYMRLLVLPINQTFEYDYPLSNSISEPETLISFLILLSIFGFAIYLFMRSRKTDNAYGLIISFGILWFFITLSVESSIIPIKDVIYEHRVYLPSIGFILSSVVAISFGINRIEKYYGITLEKHLLSVVGVIIIILAVSTYKRNVLWSDGYLMYSDNIEKSPNSASPNIALGIEYYKQNRFDEAIEEYQKAIRLNPGLAPAYDNLGGVYEKLGRTYEAIEDYQKAIRLKPDYAPAYNNLGNAYSKLGRMESAIEEYQKAIRLEPDYVRAHNNLGLAYEKLGRMESAIEEYQKAIRLEPNFAYAYNNLGNTYEKLGSVEEAIIEYQKAIKLAPDFALACYNLGLAYMKKGLNTEAIKEFKEALRIKPDFTEARQALEWLGSH